MEPINEVRLFRRGFGLKDEVACDLDNDYRSPLIDYLQAHEYTLQTPAVEILLAHEFGFCYGVDRAVDYAYETLHKFPDRRIFLTTEIIHNPRVNHRLYELGFRFLSGQYWDQSTTVVDLRGSDVVIIPAFGASEAEMERLQATGCVLVDTTCGSVANVWRRVARYAGEGYTSLVHGKYNHEETIATCSRAESVNNGKYVVVKNLPEASLVADRILEKISDHDFLSALGHACSKGFDPSQHLQRIGVANQTTMLSSESLAISNLIETAFLYHYGKEAGSGRFLSFETICSATQERQDAVLELTRHHLDAMVVVGGFNSSNTGHLSKIGSDHCPTYHIDDRSRIEGCEQIIHMHHETGELITTRNWLTESIRRIGFTAGASTPNRVVGDVIAEVLQLKEINWQTCI